MEMPPPPIPASDPSRRPVLNSPSSSPMRAHQQRPIPADSMRSTPSLPPPLFRRSSSRQSTTATLPSTSPAASMPVDRFKTAVKVAVRVRPPLLASDPGYDLIPPRFRASTCDVTSSTDIAIQSPQARKLFVFDRVFGAEVDQEGVWEYLSDSVDSFLQGYNVSILAYGQSGAGKSYTMGTSAPIQQSDPSLMGVVPRAATALFERLADLSGTKSGIRSPQRYSTSGYPPAQGAQQRSDTESDWQLRATYVEIYNEQLRDLLIPDSVSISERAQVSLREDTRGRILLTGATQVDIRSVEDLLAALSYGSSQRQTDTTNLNAQSSRSHAIFSLSLLRQKSEDPEMARQAKRRSVPTDTRSSWDGSLATDSKLHFVDLAGSERLKNTGALGERQREGISINAGLASLGKVIAQLSSSRSLGAHVSYRDSRLTRLLQDSLGGNAITYMIACITPAEFHLSETLNTIHYAQRARSIQSTPEVQQASTDADKNAQIERLQTEITFLREQISHVRDVKAASPQKNPSRHATAELQNQLLDLQESYNALKTRHAKLINELAKPRDNTDTSSAEAAASHDSLRETAVERLQRSSSFAAAVEKVVSEYEKTIQSLEGSLSNAKSSLSDTETSLVDREAQIAHMETVTQQLHSRIQKMSEREASNDAYLQDLESQLEGANSNEQSSSSLLRSLRKELSRAKDSQASSENYISTLEDRLVEAEQDHEILKCELNRLEQVVERQRSIGRLDNLLADLDTIRNAETQEHLNVPQIRTNGAVPDTEDPFVNKVPTPPSPLDAGARGLGIEPRPYELQSPVSPVQEDMTSYENFGPRKKEQKLAPPSDIDTSAESQQTPQSRFMADKLEALSQELFDLRGEHESTVNGYSELHNKYSIALQTLAKLQGTPPKDGSVDTAASSYPDSDPFLDGSGPVRAGRPISSRSSSSGQSLRSSSIVSMAREVPTITTPEPDSLGGAGHNQPNDQRPHHKPTEHAVALQQLQIEKAADLKELDEKHTQLAKAHSDALLQVEQLKLQLQTSHLRSPSPSPSAPSPSRKSPLLRRKPSTDTTLMIGNVDRANRSFALLRNIALDHFESNIDVRQNFELQLNNIMTELHSKSELVQGAEAEMATLRKQIEDKTTIIAGLTRERSTFKAAPNVDFSVVSHMQNQLTESEHQIRSLQEAHGLQEKQLQEEIEGLRTQLGALPTLPPKDASIIADLESKLEAHQSTIILHEQRIEGLQAAHAQKLSDLRESIAKADKASDERYYALQSQHKQAIEDSTSEVQIHREGMTAVVASAAAALGHDTSMTDLSDHIRDVVTANRDLQTKHISLQNDHKALEDELRAVAKSNKDLQDRLGELKVLHEDAIKSVEKITKKEQKSARLVQELEDQLNSNYDQHEDTHRRMSAVQGEKQLQLQESLHARSELEREIEDSRMRIALLESQVMDLRRRSGTPTMRDSTGFHRDSLSPEAAAIALARSNSTSSTPNNMKASQLGTTALPSPPPAIPLPPLPGLGNLNSIGSPGLRSRPTSGHVPHASVDSNLAQVVEEQETRIRTVEKHLFAEKQLTATLEEALVDLETAQNRTRAEAEAWRKRATGLEDELVGMRKERSHSRASLQAVEEEREMRVRAEQARTALENRMRELNAGNNSKKGKKRGTLNCF